MAEDNPDSQRFIADLLQQAGFQVRSASDGKAAVALFQEWKPQLVCMDMRMPVMDGYAASRAIRALPGAGQIPIIALTASAFEEDRADILAAGCNDVLSKPLETNTLFECIARHLGVEFEHGAEDEDVMEPPAQLDFSMLSAELCQRLHDAALALDGDAVREIADEIARTQPQVALAIRERAERYRFDELQQSAQTA